jgi:hypothetical protein
MIVTRTGSTKHPINRRSETCIIAIFALISTLFVVIAIAVGTKRLETLESWTGSIGQVH